MKLLFVAGGLMAPLLLLAQTPTRYRATMIGNFNEDVQFGKLNELGEVLVNYHRGINNTYLSAGIWSKGGGYEELPLDPSGYGNASAPASVSSFGVLSNTGLALINGRKFNGHGSDVVPYLYNRNTRQYQLCEYTGVDPVTNSFFSIADNGTFTLISGEPGPIGYRYTSPNSRQVLTSANGNVFRVVEMNRHGWIVATTSSSSYVTIFDPTGNRVSTILGTGYEVFNGSEVLDDLGIIVGARVRRTDPASSVIYDINGNIRYRVSSDLGSVFLHGTTVERLAGGIYQGSQALKAVVWSPNTGLQDLTPLVDGLPSSYLLTQARTPNSKGEMLALGQGMNGTNRALFFLEPVPEPASLLAVGVGLTLLGRKRCRR